MPDHPNATLVRRALDQMNAGGSDALDVLADDVEWHEIGRDEPIRGKEAVRERWASGLQGFEFTGGSLHDVIANDDHAVALMTADVRHGDDTLSYRVAEIYHVKDGKITARWAFSDDTQRINDFFGGA